ncbi:hypothetical protein LRP88_03489 [Fusarium phalaenopsidis]
MAARLGQPEMVQLLLNHGADINDKDNDSYSVVHTAVNAGEYQALDLLLKYGADVESGDPEADLPPPITLGARASVNYAPEGTQSPLFAAAYQGTDIEKAKFLLSKGADINWTWTDGWTVLHASCDAPEFVSLILEHGADINAISNDYGTVLIMAARWGHINIIRAIIAHESPKADLNLEVNPGGVDHSFSALFYAVENHNFDCASLLLETGAKLAEFRDPRQILWGFSNPLPEEMVPELLSFMKLYLQQGTDANYVDEDKNTALHWLKQHTPVQLVKLLIDSGAPVNSLNDQGLTPLAIATREGNVAVMRYLNT